MNPYIVMIAAEMAFEQAGERGLKILGWWLNQEALDALNSHPNAPKGGVTMLLRTPIFKTTSPPYLTCEGPAGEVQIDLVLPDVEEIPLPPGPFDPRALLALQHAKVAAASQWHQPERWLLGPSVVEALNRHPMFRRSAGSLNELMGLPVEQTNGKSYLLSSREGKPSMWSEIVLE